ncbi:MAG: hypothetical protein M0R76_10925 [Proteobacteria bacterium]|nr:hypothetical protein [Pseudomonadota bacterium]
MSPGKHWRAGRALPGHLSWLGAFGASSEAAMLPAMAVVAGHIGAALLQVETSEVALQRAAVGLLTTFLGAWVMSSAFAFLLLWISGQTAVPTTASQAFASSMGFVFPAWTAGIVLVVPPLLGAGPELGEILWFLLALISTLRILHSDALRVIGVRRRWLRPFRWRTAMSFALLFVAILIVPAFVARHFLQVDAIVGFIAPVVELTWPLPPPPNW